MRCLRRSDVPLLSSLATDALPLLPVSAYERQEDINTQAASVLEKSNSYPISLRPRKASTGQNGWLVISNVNGTFTAERPLRPAEHEVYCPSSPGTRVSKAARSS